jgi:hypothetical protein
MALVPRRHVLLGELRARRSHEVGQQGCGGRGGNLDSKKCVIPCRVSKDSRGGSFGYGLEHALWGASTSADSFQWTGDSGLPFWGRFPDLPPLLSCCPNWRDSVALVVAANQSCRPLAAPRLLGRRDVASPMHGAVRV